MRPGWTTVTLGDICEFKYGKALAASVRVPGDVPVYGSNGQVGLHDKAATDGQAIIIGRKGSFGEVNFSAVPCWPIDTTYYVDQSATEQDLGWLRHILPNLRLTELNRAAAVPGLNREDAYRRELQLPPIEEQRRIAAILDHANALRGAAAAALASFDDLRAATFRHMFGDVEAAMHEGGCAVFGDHVAELQGGRNLVGSDPSADAPYRVLKISAVTSGIFRPGESKPLPTDYVPASSHLVRPGDLLMSRANTTAMVGATALVSETPRNLALPDKLWRLVWRDPDRVEPIYMVALLQTPAIRRALSARSSGTGGSMKNISKAKLMQMPFPVASISEQAVFAKRARAMDSGSGGAFKRLRTLDDLARTLQARAFSGRL